MLEGKIHPMPRPRLYGDSLRDDFLVAYPANPDFVFAGLDAVENVFATVVRECLVQPIIQHHDRLRDRCQSLNVEDPALDGPRPRFGLAGDLVLRPRPTDTNPKRKARADKTHKSPPSGDRKLMAVNDDGYGQRQSSIRGEALPYQEI